MGQVGDKLELAEKASVGRTITASTAGFSVTRHTRLGREFGERVRDIRTNDFGGQCLTGIHGRADNDLYSIGFYYGVNSPPVKQEE